MALKFEDIRNEFYQAIIDDKQAQRYFKLIQEGRATYETGNRFAWRVGECLAKTLRRHAPLESIDEWDVEDLIPKSLGLDQAIVVDACKQIQDKMNKDAGLGIKFQEPKFDGNRAYGIVDELRNNPQFTNIEKSFYDQLVNFSQNIVDESIRTNADTLYRAGVRSFIIRTVEAKCCDWCEEVAGTYDYNEVKGKGNDVWRRHENCHCTIDFITQRNSSFYRERVNNQKK